MPPSHPKERLSPSPDIDHTPLRQTIESSSSDTQHDVNTVSSDVAQTRLPQHQHFRRSLEEGEKQIVHDVRKIGACESCRKKKCYHARQYIQEEKRKGRWPLSVLKHDPQRGPRAEESLSTPGVNAFGPNTTGPILQQEQDVNHDTPIGRYSQDLKSEPVYFLAGSLRDAGWSIRKEPVETAYYDAATSAVIEKSESIRSSRFSTNGNKTDSYLPSLGSERLEVWVTRGGRRRRLPNEHLPWRHRDRIKSTHPKRKRDSEETRRSRATGREREETPRATDNGQSVVKQETNSNLPAAMSHLSVQSQNQGTHSVMRPDNTHLSGPEPPRRMHSHHNATQPTAQFSDCGHSDADGDRDMNDIVSGGSGPSVQLNLTSKSLLPYSQVTPEGDLLSSYHTYYPSGTASMTSDGDYLARSFVPANGHHRQSLAASDGPQDSFPPLLTGNDFAIANRPEEEPIWPAALYHDTDGGDNMIQSYYHPQAPVSYPSTIPEIPGETLNYATQMPTQYHSSGPSYGQFDFEGVTTDRNLNYEQVQPYAANFSTPPRTPRQPSFHLTTQPLRDVQPGNTSSSPQSAAFGSSSRRSVDDASFQNGSDFTSQHPPYTRPMMGNTSSSHQSAAFGSSGRWSADASHLHGSDFTPHHFRYAQPMMGVPSSSPQSAAFESSSCWSMDDRSFQHRTDITPLSSPPVPQSYDAQGFAVTMLTSNSMPNDSQVNASAFSTSASTPVIGEQFTYGSTGEDFSFEEMLNG